MNVLPLILRELRAESRRPGNYWVRSVTAGLLTAVFVWAAWSFAGDPNFLGPHLFGYLSMGLFYAILIIISALTSDSISRERREGTLGLLFLTPLSAREIVIGKTLLHALRAGIIFFAVLPIFSLPFLLGGISSTEVITALPWFVAAFLIAIASGIFASVRATEWVQAIVTAELTCALLLAPIYFLPFSPVPLSFVAFASLQIGYGVLVLSLAIFNAGRRLKDTWQNSPAEAREPFWLRFFSRSDFWRWAFQWDTRKARDQNPIAWLQEYNWTSRLTKWGWCALLFGAQMSLLIPSVAFLRFRGFLNFQLQLYTLTALGIAFSAAASFRRERQTGALELLLVTPISAQKLIWGRLQGVWFHFLPPMAILACVWSLGPQLISLPPRYTFYLAGAYLCIPAIGFYCSLLTSNVLIAWLLTLAVSLLIPYAITQQFLPEIGRRNIPCAFFLLQLLAAATSGALLHENLARRRFALQSR